MSQYHDPEKLKDPTFCIACMQKRQDVDKHHVCAKCRKGSEGIPRRLPVVTLENGKSYFVDKRLKQLRNVLMPHDSIDFDELGLDMNPNPDAIITVSCPLCGKILFEGTRQQAKGLILYCVDC